MSITLSIVPVGPQEVDELRALLRAMAIEELTDPTAADEAAAGLDHALACYAFTRSDCFWIFLAKVGDELAGYVGASRIPKADARAGFLFVDELNVLRAFRRRGVGTALLERVEALAAELGLAGVRLLVRPENEAARQLYRAMGFDEHQTIFCEKPVET